MKKDNKYIFKENLTIKKALSAINKSGHNTIFIVDENDKLIGSLSDGDIRRALITNINTNRKIKNIYNKNPKYFYIGEFSHHEIKNLFTIERINLVPILNKNKTIYQLISWEEIFTKKRVAKKSQVLKNLPIIIMAGGKGTRLKPYTDILPKPLLPINNKAIIEHIIITLKLSGANRIIISINKLSYIMKAFFTEKNFKKPISFIEENKPLGTIGSIKLLEKKIVKDIFLVSNCDIIFDVNFEDLIKHHKKSKSLLTIVVSRNQIKSAYGSLKIDEKGFVEKIVEKPTMQQLINIGLYVFDKKILNFMEVNTKIDIDQLIKKILLNDGKVSVFEISNDSWIDTGQLKELNNAKTVLENN